MALKDPEILFKGLIELREKLNIELLNKDYLAESNSISDIEKRLESDEGISVPANEVDQIAGGALLSYKGVLAIVYISDTGKSEKYLKNNNLVREYEGKEEEKSPKFHFSWCSKLEEMKNNKRYDRYVLLRNKNNKFKVMAKGSETYFVDELVRLFPCKHCLAGSLPNDKKTLGYKGYKIKWKTKKKRNAVNNFNIGEFLAENEGVFNTIRYANSIKQKTKYTDQNVPINDYSGSFREISRKLREDANWTCPKCNVNMKNKKEGLHVHHINGVKNDNSSKNLKVLCILCHRGIDRFHHNMFVRESIETYILTHRPK